MDALNAFLSGIPGIFPALIPNRRASVNFEAFLEELPEDCLEMAHEFKVFVRSRKVKTPAQLLHLAIIYYELDAAPRDAA